MKSLRIRWILRVDRGDCDRGRRAGYSSARHEQADNQNSGALMEKPHRDASSALVATTGSRHGLWPLADHSRMYVALENKDAVFDTDERYEVARITASQAPRAIVLSTRCSGQRAESRAA